VTWRSVRATVLARQGDPQKAESLAREAVSFAAQSDFHNAHGDALMDLAEILLLAGRSNEAADALEEAIRLYEKKRNTVSAAKARTLLEASGPLLPHARPARERNEREPPLTRP